MYELLLHLLSVLIMMEVSSQDALDIKARESILSHETEDNIVHRMLALCTIFIL